MPSEPTNKITIEYQDANDNITRRTITVHDITDLGNGARLEAYCHNAKGPRTFLTERILWVITEDGEAIRLKEFLERFEPKERFSSFKWRYFLLIIWTAFIVWLVIAVISETNESITTNILVGFFVWIVAVVPIWLLLKVFDWLKK